MTDSAGDNGDGVAEGSCIVRVTSNTGGAMTLYAALDLPEEQALVCEDCFVAAQLPLGDANDDDTIIWTVPGGGGGDPCDEEEARQSSGSRSADSRNGGNGCDEEEEETPEELPVAPQSPDTNNQGQQQNESPNLTPTNEAPVVSTPEQVAGTVLEAPAAPQELPRTGGSNLAEHIRLALILMITGLGAMVIGRRRRAEKV